MNFDHQLLFFFSALGVFNGLLLAGYFFSRKPIINSNQFLAALLLMVCIRISKSIFYYFDPELARIFLQIGLSACFLIGPFLYFYLKSKLSNPGTLIQWKLHLSLLVSLLVIFGTAYPYQSNPQLWWDFFWVFEYQWLLYLLMSAYLLREEWQKLVIKRQELTDDDIWLLSVYSGIAMIWLAYYTTSYTSYILGALSFSFILYLLLLLVYIQRKRQKVVIKDKYVDKKIAQPEAQLLMQSLHDIMEQQQAFRDPNLTLPQLAKKMKISTAHLSQLLNDNLAKSFSLFVNEYRIGAAQKLLTGEKPMKMEIIAEDCGFNSNSTFYLVFKKLVGTTPAQYKKAQYIKVQ